MIWKLQDIFAQIVVWEPMSRDLATIYPIYGCDRFISRDTSESCKQILRSNYVELYNVFAFVLHGYDNFLTFSLHVYAKLIANNN